MTRQIRERLRIRVLPMLPSEQNIARKHNDGVANEQVIRAQMVPLLLILNFLIKGLVNEAEGFINADNDKMPQSDSSIVLAVGVSTTRTIIPTTAEKVSFTIVKFKGG